LLVAQALVAAGRLAEAKELLARATDLVNTRLALVKASKLSSISEGGRAVLQARRDGLKLLECYTWVEAGDKAKALKELKPLLKRWDTSSQLDLIGFGWGMCNGRTTGLGDSPK
jgi:hypothetical protein